MFPIFREAQANFITYYYLTKWSKDLLKYWKYTQVFIRPVRLANDNVPLPGVSILRLD